LIKLHNIHIICDLLYVRFWLFLDLRNII